MCFGVGKSGSPISRWRTRRPCASTARARARTSEAVSVPRSAMREERSRIVLEVYPGCLTPKVGPLLECAPAGFSAPQLTIAPPRNDDGAARDCKSLLAFRRRQRAAGGQLRGRAWRTGRDHRSERRGQAEPPELHQRGLPSAARLRPVRRARRGAQEAFGARAAGPREAL